MENQYLYLLPFKNKKYFKIGISKNNYNRILHHNCTYDIDLNNALIVTSNKTNIIKALEIELLNILPQLNENEITSYIKKDGYTEIRSIKDWNECISIIKNKHSNLNLKLTDIKFNTQRKENQKKNIYIPLEETNDIKSNCLTFLNNFKLLLKRYNNSLSIDIINNNHLYLTIFNKSLDSKETNDMFNGLRLCYTIKQSNTLKFNSFGLDGMVRLNGYTQLKFNLNNSNHNKDLSKLVSNIKKTTNQLPTKDQKKDGIDIIIHD